MYQSSRQLIQSMFDNALLLDMIVAQCDIMVHIRGSIRDMLIVPKLKIVLYIASGHYYFLTHFNLCKYSQVYIFEGKNLLKYVDYFGILDIGILYLTHAR